jgi:hypothetical protein
MPLPLAGKKVPEAIAAKASGTSLFISTHRV